MGLRVNYFNQNREYLSFFFFPLSFCHSSRFLFHSPCLPVASTCDIVAQAYAHAFVPRRTLHYASRRICTSIPWWCVLNDTVHREHPQSLAALACIRHTHPRERSRVRTCAAHLTGTSTVRRVRGKEGERKKRGKGTYASSSTTTTSGTTSGEQRMAVKREEKERERERRRRTRKGERRGKATWKGDEGVTAGSIDP